MDAEEGVSSTNADVSNKDNDNGVDSTSRGGGGDASATEGDTPMDVQETEENENEEDGQEEEQLVASFPEEDSRSRDGSAVHGLGDDESRDQKSGDNDDPISRENTEDNAQRGQNNEESNDSASKLSHVSKENGPSSHEEQPQETQEPSLLADETLGEDEENIVSEVDISSMMEVNYGEDNETNHSQDNSRRDEEPEVIPIDSDDDDNSNSKNNDSEAVVASVDQRVFQVDEDDNVTEMDVSSMMQVDFGVNSEDIQEVLNNDSDSNPPSVASSTTSTSRRPRRAAAAAAAKTIHQISSVEKGVSSAVFRHRRKSQEDSEFDPYSSSEANQLHSSSSVPAAVKLQMCHMCKKGAACSIVIKQFGSDLFLCSNLCFNRFRNQGTNNGYKPKTLPCAKCSLMDKQASSSSNEVFYWETMNFCSDLCVGHYQMDVGSKCCTCGKHVSWNSLGKYCVRFGSDIRQFCTPQCLEEYKKSARVCFHCQLDIRRVGNVILANIPTKNSPKEFCSNDCVEMYCDRNLNQPTRVKPPQEHVCCSCQCRKFVHKELMLTNGNFKACSELCWTKMLKTKGVTMADKCEMCTKFVNMDLGFTTPVYWVSTMNKVYGFCSHVCKNLYILNSRKIMSCTSCKVKKYNFDLIEYFTNSSSTYAVCSLACLPKSSDYLKNIRSILYLPQPTSDKTTPSAVTLGSSATVISSAPSGSTIHYPPARNRKTTKTSATYENNVTEISNPISELKIGDTDNILDILTIDEIKAVLEELQSKRPQMRSVMCSAIPKTRTIETQTDVSELNELRLIPLKSSEDSAKLPNSTTPSVENTTAGKENSVSQKDAGNSNSHNGLKETESGNVSETATPTIMMNGGTTSNVTTNSKDLPRRRSSDKSDGNGISSLDTEVSNEHNNSLQQKSAASAPMQSTIAAAASTRDLNSTPKACASVNSVTPSQQFSGSSNQSSVYSPSYSHSPYPSPSVEPLAPNPPPSNPLPTPPSVNSQSSSSSTFGGNYVNAPTPSNLQLQPTLPTHPPSSLTTPLGYGIHSQTLGYSRPTLPITAIVPPHQHTAPKNRVDYAFHAWRIMFGPASDPRSCAPTELSYKLCELVNRGYSTDGKKYRADTLMYISLGIQEILTIAKRVDKIFYDNVYYSFVLALTDTAGRDQLLGPLPTVDELNFWETLELGATSPGVLLFTLIYLFKKHFGLSTWEMQSALHFSHIMLQSRYDQFGKFVKYLSIVGMPGVYPTEVAENFNHPERCFVKIYEFYCFKNESREGPFFKCLRQDYTPRSPWFTCEPLHQRHIHQMLVRASMIKFYGFS